MATITITLKDHSDGRVEINTTPREFYKKNPLSMTGAERYARVMVAAGMIQSGTDLKNKGKKPNMIKRLFGKK